MKQIVKVSYLIAIILYYGCNKPNQNKIENVVLIVIDGPRKIDLHADSLNYYNGGFMELKKKGMYFSNFTNDGETNTQNGMSSMITGMNESLVNNGSEYSEHPNIFHKYLKHVSSDSNKTWIISSKGKLGALKFSQDSQYINQYKISTYTGKNGTGSGIADDSNTYAKAMEVLRTKQPRLIMITFKEPDAGGHSGVWMNYKIGMKKSLEYTNDIVDFLMSDGYYQSNTLVLITNDHGRHLDGIADGFISHGDGCQGCRDITMVAISSKIPGSSDESTNYSLRNIASTIADLFNFQLEDSEAKPIYSIY